MLDKGHDDFFDEKFDEETPQDKLLKMIDGQDTATTQEFKVGDRIEGTVLSVGKEYVFLDIGAKNEALVKKGELADKEGNPTVKPGDRVEAYVVSNTNNEIILSKSLSGRKVDLGELAAAMEGGIPVQGRITGINKGGFNVSVMGHRAFCPVSHIDLKFVEDPNPYLSKTLDFVVTRIEERGRNIVLSRIPILEGGLEARLDEIVRAAADHTVLTGTITRIADFGLFVDLGGVEGLVHVSEVSWERAEDLAGTFSPGQGVECVVLKVERKERIRDSRISLSIKQVLDNPWDTVAQKFSAGQTVPAKVTRLATFGAFVQLTPGIEGLVHVSEMSWAKHVRHPSDVVKEGDNVQVTILSIDEGKRSISCSLRDNANDPWNDVPAKFAVGTHVTGTVASKTKFGFFVDLAEGVTGLLPHRNIAQEKKAALKVGESIEVGIESLDVDNRRLSLTFGVEGAAVDGDVVAREYMATQTQRTPASSEFGEMLKNALNKKK